MTIVVRQKQPVQTTQRTLTEYEAARTLRSERSNYSRLDKRKALYW